MTWRIFDALLRTRTPHPLTRLVTTKLTEWEPNRRWSIVYAILAFSLLLVARAPAGPITASTLGLIAAVLATTLGWMAIALAILPAITGITYANLIASVLGAERQRGRYDLLRLTPRGESGAAWANASASVRRPARFFALDVHNGLRTHLLMTMLIALMAGAIARVYLINNPFTADADTIPTMVILLALVPHVDLRQNLVLGSLCGLLAGRWARARLTARVLALALMATVQLGGSFLLALVAAALYNPLNPTPAGFLTAIGAGLLAALAFREAMVWGLWHILVMTMAEIRDLL